MSRVQWTEASKEPRKRFPYNSHQITSLRGQSDLQWLFGIFGISTLNQYFSVENTCASLHQYRGQTHLGSHLLWELLKERQKMFSNSVNEYTFLSLLSLFHHNGSVLLPKSATRLLLVPASLIPGRQHTAISKVCTGTLWIEREKHNKKNAL